MSPSMKIAISLLLVCTLVITCATEDSPLYLKAFEQQRKTYTYRHLTRQEIKEAVARSVLRKKLFIRVILVLIKAAVFFYLTSRLLSPHEAVLFTGWNELTLGLVLGGIREIEVDPRIEAIEADNMLRVRITKPMTIEFEKKSGDAKLLAIMLDKATLLPAPKRQNHLSQKAIAACTGYSQAHINTLIKRYEDYGLEGLSHLPRGGLLKKEAQEKVLAYLKEDISLTPQAICRRLEKEGLEATTAAVKNCLARVDLLKLQPAIREQLNTEGVHPHLLERIFELIEEILSYTTVPECLSVEIKDIKKHFRRPPSGESKSRRWDQEIVRVYNKERRAEKERVLKNKLENKKTAVACPECRGTSVQIKEYRERSYEDLYGERKEEAVRYTCNRCHRNFTINPEEVEHYQRTASCIHIHALGQLFNNVSLARVDLDTIPDHISVCKTTILRWMKGTADKMPRWSKVMGSRTTGVVSVDEKWVKLRSKWYYVFIAVDTSTLDILHIDIFPERKKDSARTFFLKLRTMGFKFRTIITDGCPIYDKPLAEIYPQAEHVNCILHMGRSRRNRLMEVFGSYSDKRYKRLAPLISDIYAARTEKAFEKAWDKWSRAYKEYPELEKFARDFRREKEELKKSLLRGSIPRTTNSVERVIKEFERKYSNMENYMSLPYAQAWCKLFQVYFRLRPFLEGKRAGKSPAELMGYPVSNLSWKEFLKPEGEYIRDDAAA